MTALVAQLKMEFRLAMRNGEQLLVNLIIPIGALVLFTRVDVFNEGMANDRANAVVPRILALAIMSSAMVSLGIGAGFERYYNVLKRLGSTPLGRGRWVSAKVLLVIAIVCIQWVVLVALGVALGWSPDVDLLLLVFGLVGGVASFAGIGLTLAGRLPGLVNLAVCNALYVVLLSTSGMIVPLDKFGDALGTALLWSPAGALTDVMSAATNTHHAVSSVSLVALALWAVVAPLVATSTFRWE